jgi:hypothetical protein
VERKVRSAFECEWRIDSRKKLRRKEKRKKGNVECKKKIKV